MGRIDVPANFTVRYGVKLESAIANAGGGSPGADDADRMGDGPDRVAMFEDVDEVTGEGCDEDRPSEERIGADITGADDVEVFGSKNTWVGMTRSANGVEGQPVCVQRWAGELTRRFVFVRAAPAAV